MGRAWNLPAPSPQRQPRAGAEHIRPSHGGAELQNLHPHDPDTKDHVEAGKQQVDIPLALPSSPPGWASYAAAPAVRTPQDAAVSPSIHARGFCPGPTSHRRGATGSLAPCGSGSTGEWCGQAEWMRFARLIHRPVAFLADLRSAPPSAAI
jgi:hypothetical protein